MSKPSVLLTAQECGNLELVVLLGLRKEIVRRALRRGLLPLNALSSAIKQRHAAALAPLSAEQTPTELQPLVQALNDLLQQLRRALEQQRHFIADAAHEIEYYDIAKDPYELTNVAGHLTAAQKAELHEVLTNLQACHSGAACWKAALPS